MAGLRRDEDTLPSRFFRELLKEGPPKDIPMTEQAFQQALSEYYEYRGWDSMGRPGIERLKKLEVEQSLIDKYSSYL